MKIADFGIGNGTVNFIAEKPETPTTSTTEGNVTINNIGTPKIPCHYEVTFNLRPEFAEEGVTISNSFYFTTAVFGHDENSPYREVEDKAVRQLVPMLESIVQSLRTSIDEYDKRQKPD